ncbi:MAG: hypothetical protein RIR18_859 [Pseudomonadota bacterium]
MIPDSFIQDLLARADIVDVVESYLKLKKSGANYSACCPFHNEKSPSFTVSPNKQFYHCFGCGAHGTAISFIMEYAGLGFVEAVHDLANRLGMAVPQEQSHSAGFAGSGGESARPVVSPGKIRGLADIMLQALQFYKTQLKQSPQAIEYLKKRGLTGEIAARFGIGYAPAGFQNLMVPFPQYNDPNLVVAGLVIENEQGRRYDRFRERIMFPIINPKGDVIGFGGRVLDKGEPKYLNSPETPLFLKGQEVFGLPQARQALRETNTAIVVEGYMDVVALAQHGVGNAVATLGTATTPTHIRKLLRQVDRLVFCFDGDNAGRKAAWRALENALETLVDNKQVGFVFLPEADDPDSFVRAHGAEAFQRVIQQATPLSDFLLQELSSRCDMASAEGRAKLIHEAKPLLTLLPTPSLRLQIVKRLSDISGFSQAEVERLCDLRPIAKRAPARAPRQAPSINRTLLQCVLSKPALALRLPSPLPAASLADVNTPEYVALTDIANCVCDHVENTGQVPTYPLIREALRGMGSAAMVQTLIGQMLEQPQENEDEMEQEFSDILAKLSHGPGQQAFDQLQAKARSLGVAGLSEGEKRQYLDFLAKKK